MAASKITSTLSSLQEIVSSKEPPELARLSSVLTRMFGPDISAMRDEAQRIGDHQLNYLEGALRETRALHTRLTKINLVAEWSSVQQELDHICRQLEYSLQRHL